jgi:predicted nucleic acid-binding protein
MRVIFDTLGIRVTGTIGILLAAKKNGFGPAVDEALRLLDAAGFRMSAELAAAFRRL